jgi:hypothetical protein
MEPNLYPSSNGAVCKPGKQLRTRLITSNCVKNGVTHSSDLTKKSLFSRNNLLETVIAFLCLRLGTMQQTC